MRSSAPMRAVLGSAGFAVAGTLVEAVAGPFLVTGGFEAGDDLPAILRPVGALLVACGLAVLADVYVRLARDGRGTPSPLAPTSRLVVAGAYRVVRHPMYVATAAVIAGEGLILRRALLVACAAGYLAALALLARVVEDPLLRRRHGASYDAYRASTPGWAPRPRKRDHHR